MGIMVRERAQYHESGLMEVVQQKQGTVQNFDGSDLLQQQGEPRLPSGWEKCLDLKSGLIYFKDWNSGTLTYRDPRQSVQPQRIGLLSISLDEQVLQASTSMKRKTMELEEQSLELSLNLPGASRQGTGSSTESVCTMEKVRSALERSQWLQSQQHSHRHRLNRLNDLKQSKSTSTTTTPKSRDHPGTTLSLLSSEDSSCRSRLFHLESGTSQSECSDSECFTSPSVMSYQGDDSEEVQQPRECKDGAKSQLVDELGSQAVMVTVGCKSCLMYVMLSKSHPSCPKCGNTDVLLELPVPLPKKRRIQSPSWSWCTA